MITKERFKERFKEIYDEVEKQVIDTLKKLEQDNPQDYVLFLANGEYRELITAPYSPYTIDNRTDVYRDLYRNKFLLDFLEKYYLKKEPLENLPEDEKMYKIHLELMIYTHIWESKPFLKKLHRLAVICNKEDYPWVEDDLKTKKYEFINEIKENFNKANSGLSEIIGKAYNSSLRNAFAHSDYAIDEDLQKIILLNHNPENNWSLEDISFNDWEERFCYSALLCYHLLERVNIAKQQLIPHGEEEKTFAIKHPDREGGINDNRKIVYNKKEDAFRFVQHKENENDEILKYFSGIFIE